MSHSIPIYTLILALLCGTPVFSAAEGDDTETGAESTVDSDMPDMEALYKIDRSEAGNLPGDMLLGQQLPADTVVLTMETGDQRFHALRQEAEQADPLGWILLLPDPGMGPAWPEQTEALRFDLARHGWLTLVLEPPRPNAPELPERTLPVMKSVTPLSAAADATGDETPESPASQDANARGANESDTNESNADAGSVAENDDEMTPQPPFAERFNERISMVLEQLPREENQLGIVLAIGRAANWSAAYVAAHPELEAGLILIDPLPDSDPDAPMLSQLWESLASVPVLDLYHVPLPGYPQAAPDARIRKAQAIRAEMEQYHQARIAPPFTGWQREMPWLTQTVRGLIKKRIIEPADKAREMVKYAAPEPRQTPPGTNKR